MPLLFLENLLEGKHSLDRIIEGLINENKILKSFRIANEYCV